MLRDRLAELRPGEHILGEEEGGSTAVGDGLTWVLDPIDGTVNFVYGIETYAVSVAVQRDGASVAGAVANVPTGALYSAALGHGADVRRADVTTPLRASTIEELSMSLVGTGFSYRREQRIRRPRSSPGCCPSCATYGGWARALDLCMVAAGALDAYYEDGVHVWDWAAGRLIAAEAGAKLLLPPVDGGAGGLWWRPHRASPTRWRASFVGPERCERRICLCSNGIGLAGGVVNLLQQRRIGGLGGIRAQAGQHRVDVVAVGQFGELGADGQVHGVVASLVWNSSVQGATSQTAAAAARPDGPNRIWPWHCQPGVDIHGVVGRGGFGEAQVAQFAGHLGGLATLPLALSTRILVSASLAGVTRSSWRAIPARRAAAGRPGWPVAAARCRRRPHVRRPDGLRAITQTSIVTTASATNSRIPGR